MVKKASWVVVVMGTVCACLYLQSSRMGNNLEMGACRLDLQRAVVERPHVLVDLDLESIAIVGEADAISGDIIIITKQRVPKCVQVGILELPDPHGLSLLAHRVISGIQRTTSSRASAQRSATFSLVNVRRASSPG